MDLGDAIREQGWRQGCLLDRTNAEALLVDTDEVEDYADFVLVSHSCDVVSADLVKEPEVEFIGRRHLESLDGNFTFAKSPRAWHMADSTGTYELHMSSRRRLARELLAELPPSGSLAGDQVRILRRWLANRYARAAFADEFNRRCRPAQNRISSRLKKDGARLSGIYLLVDEAELPTDKYYEVVVIGTMLEDEYEIAAHRSDCQGAINFVTEQLDSCSGIRIIDSELRSESAVSLSDLRELSRWDYDSLSLRDDSTELPVLEQGN